MIFTFEPKLLLSWVAGIVMEEKGRDWFGSKLTTLMVAMQTKKKDKTQGQSKVTLSSDAWNMQRVLGECATSPKVLDQSDWLQIGALGLRHTKARVCERRVRVAKFGRVSKRFAHRRQIIILT